MEIKDLLPIGSVVTLVNGKKQLMIYGVKQLNQSTKMEHDYIGVLFPEGNIGPDYQFLFDHDKIKEVNFLGFKSDEREEFLVKLEKIQETKNGENS